MTRRISLVVTVICVALALGAPAAWGGNVSPGLADRTSATQPATAPVPDWFERAAAAAMSSSPVPDWFERAAATAMSSNRAPVVDDRFRLGSSTVPAPVATDSGRELDWSQLAIGFGVGIVLMLGLYLAAKTVRRRPLAH